MSDEIYQFIEARIDESERACQGMRFPGIDFMQVFFDNMRCTLEFHKNWPILVESPPVYDPPNFLDDFQADINSYTMSMSKQIAWLTEREYVKKFGKESPTTPMLRVWASSWGSHPDFKPEWMLTREEWQRHLGVPREGNTVSDDQ